MSHLSLPTRRRWPCVLEADGVSRVNEPPSFEPSGPRSSFSSKQNLALLRNIVQRSTRAGAGSDGGVPAHLRPFGTSASSSRLTSYAGTPLADGGWLHVDLSHRNGSSRPHLEHHRDHVGRRRHGRGDRTSARLRTITAGQVAKGARFGPAMTRHEREPSVSLEFLETHRLGRLGQRMESAQGRLEGVVGVGATPPYICRPQFWVTRSLSDPAMHLCVFVSRLQ